MELTAKKSWPTPPSEFQVCDEVHHVCTTTMEFEGIRRMSKGSNEANEAQYGWGMWAACHLIPSLPSYTTCEFFLSSWVIQPFFANIPTKTHSASTRACVRANHASYMYFSAGSSGWELDVRSWEICSSHWVSSCSASRTKTTPPVLCIAHAPISEKSAFKRNWCILF